MSKAEPSASTREPAMYQYGAHMSLGEAEMRCDEQNARWWQIALHISFVSEARKSFPQATPGERIVYRLSASGHTGDCIALSLSAEATMRHRRIEFSGMRGRRDVGQLAPGVTSSAALSRWACNLSFTRRNQADEAGACRAARANVQGSREPSHHDSPRDGTHGLLAGNLSTCQPNRCKNRPLRRLPLPCGPSFP